MSPFIEGMQYVDSLSKLRAGALPVQACPLKLPGWFPKHNGPAGSARIVPPCQRSALAVGLYPRTYTALPVHDLINPTRWNTDSFGQLVLADLQGLQKLFKEHFTWVGWGKVSLTHILASMVGGGPLLTAAPWSAVRTARGYSVPHLRLA